MKSFSHPPPSIVRFMTPAMQALAAALILGPAPTLRAALLAYEPFTNSAGATIIGSSGGLGFSGAWQANASGGVATNTSYALSYTDAASNTLVTAGGAGLFQGLTTANTSMQPIRLFNFSRGTNGTDGVTTWISFLVARQGPTGTLAGNPYGRGANIAHDLSLGSLQKLAIGNSSGAATNTVGLIPLGNANNLKSSTNTFGPYTNFVVVRIDHLAGGNDNAWLFVNPLLSAEPSTNSANASSVSGYDFSFDRVRPFAGGQNNASQPYAEMVLDEYRVGQTYADVTPYLTGSAPTTGPIVITNTAILGGNLVLSGTGGSAGGTGYVVSSTSLAIPSSAWQAIATNQFDASGNFNWTNPASLIDADRLYRVMSGTPLSAGVVAPFIISQPQNQTVTIGQNATFSVLAGGDSQLSYQWYFNTNTPIAGAVLSSFTVTNSQSSNGGAYSVVITNAAGSITSTNAFLTVRTAVAPTITTQPASLSVILSNNATFSVTATGTTPLFYQWYFNTNTLLAAAVSSSLTITNAQNSNGGAYSVMVSNAIGSILSSNAVLTILPTVITNGSYFVSPSGNDSNPGTIDSPFLTITRGLTAVGNGGLLYLRGGTYPMTSKLSLNRTASPTNRIRIWAIPGETPVIDNTGISSSSDGIGISGNWYHLKGIEQKFAGHNGINISGNSNIVEFCVIHENGNTGLHITGGTSGTTFPSYNLILNCDSYLNYDPPIGGNADGFTAKWDLGPGNVFSGCRAWLNSDDGWDLWMGTSTVIITNCWSFWAGTNYWNSSQFAGNGNGFKLGGNYVGTPHRIVRSAAFRNSANGVDQNNNIAGQTVDNVTSWGNGGRNFDLNHGTNTTPHVVRNNLSIGGGSGDTFTSGSLLTNNSWQVISPVASTSDLQSVDISYALAPRQADGSLPASPFLLPVVGGRLVDKGVDTGDPYNGAAPDLGAFESP